MQHNVLLLCLFCLFLSFKWNGSIYIYPRFTHLITQYLKHWSLLIMLLYPTWSLSPCSGLVFIKHYNTTLQGRQGIIKRAVCITRRIRFVDHKKTQTIHAKRIQSLKKKKKFSVSQHTWPPSPRPRDWGRPPPWSSTGLQTTRSSSSRGSVISTNIIH